MFVSSCSLSIKRIITILLSGLLLLLLSLSLLLSSSPSIINNNNNNNNIFVVLAQSTLNPSPRWPDYLWNPPADLPTPNSITTFRDKIYEEFTLSIQLPTHENMTIQFINCTFQKTFNFENNVTFAKDSKLIFIDCRLRIIMNSYDYDTTKTSINFLPGSSLEFHRCLVEPRDDLVPSASWAGADETAGYGRGIDILLSKISNNFTWIVRDCTYRWVTSTYQRPTGYEDYYPVLPRSGFRIEILHHSMAEMWTEYEIYKMDVLGGRDTLDGYAPSTVFKYNNRYFNTIEFSNNSFETNHGALPMISVDINPQPKLFSPYAYPHFIGAVFNVSLNTVHATFEDGDGKNYFNFGQRNIQHAVLGTNLRHQLSCGKIIFHKNIVRLEDIATGFGRSVGLTVITLGYSERFYHTGTFRDESPLYDTKLISISENNFFIRGKPPESVRDPSPVNYSTDIRSVDFFGSLVDDLFIINNTFEHITLGGDSVVHIEPSEEYRWPLNKSFVPTASEIIQLPSWLPHRRQVSTNTNNFMGGNMVIANNNITTTQVMNSNAIHIYTTRYFNIYLSKIAIYGNIIRLNYDLGTHPFPYAVEPLVAGSWPLVCIFTSAAGGVSGLNKIQNFLIYENDCTISGFPDVKPIALTDNFKNVSFLSVTNNTLKVIHNETTCERSVPIENFKSRQAIPLLASFVISGAPADNGHVVISENRILMDIKCTTSARGILFAASRSDATTTCLFERVDIKNNHVQLFRKRLNRLDLHFNGIAMSNIVRQEWSFGHFNVSSNFINMTTTGQCSFFGCVAIAVDMMESLQVTNSNDTSFTIENNQVINLALGGGGGGGGGGEGHSDEVDRGGRTVGGVCITYNNMIDFDSLMSTMAAQYLSGILSGVKFYSARNNNFTLSNRNGGVIGFAVIASGKMDKFGLVEFSNNTIQVLPETFTSSTERQDQISLFGTQCPYGSFRYYAEIVKSVVDIALECKRGHDILGVKKFWIQHNELVISQKKEQIAEYRSSSSTSSNSDFQQAGQFGSIMNVKGGFEVTEELVVEGNRVSFSTDAVNTFSSAEFSAFLFDPVSGLTPTMVNKFIIRNNTYNLDACSSSSSSASLVSSSSFFTFKHLSSSSKLISFPHVQSIDNVINFINPDKNKDCFPSMSTSITTTSETQLISIPPSSTYLSEFNISLTRDRFVSSTSSSSSLSFLNSDDETLSSTTATGTALRNNLDFTLHCLKWNDEDMFLKSDQIKSAVPLVGASLRVKHCKNAQELSSTITLSEQESLTPEQLSFSHSLSSSSSKSNRKPLQNFGSSEKFERNALASQTTAMFASIISPNPSAVAAIAKGIVLSRLALCYINQKDRTHDEFVMEYANHTQNKLQESVEFPSSLLPGLKFSEDVLGAELRGAIFSFCLAVIILLIFVAFQGKVRKNSWVKYCGQQKRLARSGKGDSSSSSTPTFNENISCLQYSHLDKFILKPILFMTPFWFDAGGMLLGASSVLPEGGSDRSLNQFLVIFPLVVVVIIVLKMGYVMWKYVNATRSDDESTSRDKKTKNSRGRSSSRNHNNNGKQNTSSRTPSDPLEESLSNSDEFLANHHHLSSTPIPKHYLEDADLFCTRGASSPFQLRLRSLLRHKIFGRFLLIGNMAWNTFGKFDDLNEMLTSWGPGIETQFRMTLMQYQGPLRLQQTTKTPSSKSNSSKKRHSITEFDDDEFGNNNYRRSPQGSQNQHHRQFHLDLTPSSSSSFRGKGLTARNKYHNDMDQDNVLMISPSSSMKNKSNHTSRSNKETRSPRSASHRNDSPRNIHHRHDSRESIRTPNNATTSSSGSMRRPKSSSSRRNFEFPSEPPSSESINTRSHHSSTSSMNINARKSSSSFDFSLRRRLQPLTIEYQILLTILVCLLGGVGKTDLTTCYSNFIVVLIITILDFLIMLWLRPYIILLKTLTPLLVQFFIVIAGFIYSGIVFSSETLQRDPSSDLEWSQFERTQGQINSALALTSLPGLILCILSAIAAVIRVMSLKLSKSCIATKTDIRSALKRELDDLEEELLPTMRSNCENKVRQGRNNKNTSGEGNDDDGDDAKKNKNTLSSRGGAGFFGNLF